jgi:hypothetical protein
LACSERERAATRESRQRARSPPAAWPACPRLRRRARHRRHRRHRSVQETQATTERPGARCAGAGAVSVSRGQGHPQEV